jgi:hypothetical protein
MLGAAHRGTLTVRNNFTSTRWEAGRPVEAITVA